MLLEIRFLDGYYGGTQQQTAEWPPSPARLYSALINAFYTMQRAGQPVDREVLLWLENQPAPEIHYPHAINTGTLPSVYVPVNDYEKGSQNNQNPTHKFPNRQERKFPSVHSYSPYIYYNWPGLQPHPDFQKLVNYLDQLGTSRSMIVPRLLETLPDHAKKFIHLQPCDEGSGKRIPCYFPGRLDMSDQSYQQGGKTPNEFVSYKLVRPPVPPTFSYFQQDRIFTLKGPYWLVSTHTALIADAIRGKLLNIARRLDVAPNALIGKTQTPHMAYMSLPFVGRHGDGVIKGVNIAIPKGIPDEELEQCNRIVATFLEEGGSFSYRNEEWSLSLVNENDVTPKTLQRQTWNNPSRYWRTVTPAEINWKVNSEVYIYELFQKLGYPIKYVRCQPYPFFGGIDESTAYFRRNLMKAGRDPEKKLLGGYLTHCEVEFERPVAGPITIGNTANFGFGLMRPCNTIEE